MSEPYIGEIRLFPYLNYVPQGWFLCDGTIYQVRQYMPLFAVLGGIYGGDGKNTFAVPQLAGFVAMGQSQVHPLADVHGAQTTTLTQAELPPHNHTMMRKVNTKGYAGKTARPSATSTVGGFQTLVNNAPVNINVFTPTLTSPVALNPATLGYTPAVNSTEIAHNNMQPYLTLRYAIAWDGIYPVPDNN